MLFKKKKKQVAHPLQDFAINHRFCWLFIICLEIDIFSRLSLLLERVDDAETVVKVNRKSPAFNAPAHEFNLLPQNTSFFFFFFV